MRRGHDRRGHGIGEEVGPGLLAERRDDRGGARGVPSRGPPEGLSQRRVDDVPPFAVRVEVLVGASEVGAYFNLGFGREQREKSK